VYSIICNITCARYIGSSIDIGIRLIQHLVTNNTNEHLQNAIAKYGLENFTFAVVEFCDLEVLLQREQHYLDILFSLPANLRYNFSPTAGSSLGVVRSEETRTDEKKINIFVLSLFVGCPGRTRPGRPK
jgi:group I intron endonuclease